VSFDAIVGGIVGGLIGGLIAAIAPAIVRLWRGRSRRKPSSIAPPIPDAAAPPTAPRLQRSGELDAEGYPVYLHVHDELPTGPHGLLPYPTPMNAAHELAQIAAPMSRETYARNTFIGRWVRWTGIVSNVREEDGVHRVATRSAYGRSGGLVILMFPLTRRPEVEALREGEEITYEGQIRAASEIGFSLVRVEILPIA
jgi:hypothetical protein